MNHRPTIAIINNERNILTSLRMAFEAEGFRVRCYSDTASALALLEDPADIALLDKTNPPLGGVELFRRLRARHAMPVIFLSGWSDELLEEYRGTDLEAEGYHSTPFSQRAVVAEVKQLLQRHPPKLTIALVSERLRHDQEG